MTSPGWRVWVDTGGTFTDCVAVDPEGLEHRVKVLSDSSLRGTLQSRLGPRRLAVGFPWQLVDGFLAGSCCRILGSSAPPVPVLDWDAGGGVLELAEDPGELMPGSAVELRFEEEAPVLAARLVTGTPIERPLPPLAMRLATTRGTNALLERRGARLALFVTRGFADLLLIGTQQRPDLFTLDIHRPQPLYESVIEIDERLSADGSVLRSLDVEEVIRHGEEVVASGLRVAAVALAHSFKHPEHERRAAAVLRDCGFDHVSCSSDLAPFAGLLPRAETAVVDAYLAQVVGDYLEAVVTALSGGSLHVMTSAGGLVRAADYRARDSLLSGPAGGVVGAARAGRSAGFDRVIAFDMGGTSTDAARIDGDYEYLYETRLGDVRMVAPTLAIESVAAGGGSICNFDGERLRVGPESSGARPGPACYGAGGPLSLTDVNLLLGRLDASRFEIPIDRHAAETMARRLQQEVIGSGGGMKEMEVMLEGLLRIADERMADAIRTISVRRGYDPRDYCLVAFGGAGGQHACGVAELLGMNTVLVPADASLLSARGLGGACIERFAQRQVLTPLETVIDSIPEWFEELATEALVAVRREGIESEQIEIRRRLLGLRLVGQDSTVEVPFRGGGVDLAADFSDAYQRIHGYSPGERPIEVESIRVVASSIEVQRPTRFADPEPRPAVAAGEIAAYFQGSWQKIPSYEREDLVIGSAISGPAVVFERHSSTTVADGWRLRVDGSKALLMETGGDPIGGANSADAS